MKDAVSIERIKKLHPKLVQEVLNTIAEIESAWPLNAAIRIVQGLRTIEEQNELFAKGRTKPGPRVTDAKGGSSFHNYGLAFDFALLYDKDSNGSFETLSWNEKDPHWREVVEAFEAKDWFWGGKFSKLHDAPHLQKTYGFKWQQLLIKYDAKDFLSGTNYVNV